MNFSSLKAARILPFTKTKKFQSEAYLLYSIRPEGDMAKTNRKMDDIPGSQENSGGLQESG